MPLRGFLPAHLPAAADDGLAEKGGDASAGFLRLGNCGARRRGAVQVLPAVHVGAGQYMHVRRAAGAARAVELVGRQVNAGVGVAVVGVVQHRHVQRLLLRRRLGASAVASLLCCQVVCVGARNAPGEVVCLAAAHNHVHHLRVGHRWQWSS